MQVKQLIEMLKEFDPDDCVIFSDTDEPDSGWCNIEAPIQKGSAVAIVGDYTRPFSSDN